MIEDQRIGQFLLREGAITEEQLKQALEMQKESYGKALGEVMIEMNIVTEADFLRVLAKKFHTQYLTTKKLSELKVPEAVLKMIPVATVEKHVLFPVQYKKSDKSLTVVITDPSDMAAMDEVKFVSGVGNLRALVGIKGSIQAAIDKWYKNEKGAFDMLLGISGDGYEIGGTMGAAEGLEEKDAALDLSALITSPDSDDSEAVEIEEIQEQAPAGSDEEALYLGGMESMPGDDNLSRESVVIEDVGDEGPVEVEEVTVAPISPEAEEPAEEPKAEAKTRRADVKKYRLRMLVVDSHDSIRKFIVKLFAHEGFKVRGVASRDEAIEELSQGEYDSLVIKEKEMGEGEEFINLMNERFPGVELCSVKDYGSAMIGETRAQRRLMTSFLETLDVLMGLLEMESGGMQGHSHNTAKYCRLIASKLDLPVREVDTIALAASVHEIGKKGLSHRSLLRIEEKDDEDLAEQAEIPLKLLSSAKFPLDIGPILRHQYERWDGKGFPDGVAGEEIPLGARVLSLVEAFEDLTSKYTGNESMEPTAALEIIKKKEGKLFDPNLVDIFLGVVRDDIYLQQMSGTQERILIVDTEADLITLLELRLVNMGFAVSSARTGREGIDRAKSDAPAMIITEADLPDISGFEMIEEIKGDPETRDIHFLFLSRKDDSASVNRGFKLGAEDYMIKPIKVDILGAKINTMMSRIKTDKKAPAAAGVSGSLSEMGIPDIVQILGAGRKTGRITLEDNGNTCYIDMAEGQVINASIEDLKGEEAFYKILYWTTGSFSIDPNASVDERLITISNDSLMLEGFRRMDEETQGGPREDDITLDGSDFF